MGERPKLSVVIPTRDTRRLTMNCLASLWLCTEQPDEVVVVDDGSEDGTASAVLHRFPRHIVVRLPKSQGFSVAANHGVAKASGDLVLLLNSDTEVDPNSISVITDSFERNPDLGIAGAALQHPGGSPQWSGGRNPSPLWCFALASGIPALVSHLPGWRRLRAPSGSSGGRVDWVAGTAMVVRREVWRDVGPFDIGYRLYCQDLDLCFKARKAGWRIEILPDFNVLHHHGSTISSQGGAVGALHPEHMWADLIRFDCKRRGDSHARNSGRWLLMGGRLRVLGRSLTSPLIPSDRKSEFRSETTAYNDALRTIREFGDRDHSQVSR